MIQNTKYNDLTSDLFVIENYTIEKNNRLGGGVQGQIFKAKMKKRDENKQIFEEEIVAKIIKVNEMNKNMCQREKDIVLEIKKRPSNINVIQCFDIKTHIEDEETLQMTFMEKCDCDLKNFMDEKLRSNSWFSYQEILNFASQIIKGYQLLLECNIIHRDLKPENILVKRINNEIILKICDFGIGKCLNQDYAITNLGTPFYTPKEGLQNEPYTNKFDVYSLGIIFYQLVYQGKYPFEKRNFKNFLDSLQNNPLTCPPIANIPKQFLTLIENMITYSPDLRIGWQEIRNEEIFSDFFQIQKPQSENRILNLIQYFMLIFQYSNKIVQILQKLPKNLPCNYEDSLYLEFIIYKIQNFIIEQVDQLKNKKSICIQSLMRTISTQQLEETSQNELNNFLKDYKSELNQYEENKNKLETYKQQLNKLIQNQYFYQKSIFSDEKQNQETFDYWFIQFERAYKDLLRPWLQKYLIKKILTLEELYKLERFCNITLEFPLSSFNQINKNQLQSKIVVKSQAEEYLKSKGIF